MSPRTEYHRYYWRAYRSTRFHLVPDMPRKLCGRAPKLTLDQYREARHLRALQGPQRPMLWELAERYGVSLNGLSVALRRGIKRYDA